MAFNDAGTPVWLDVGASLAWSYNFGNNSEALYAMANCKTPDGLMITDWQGEKLEEDGSVNYYIQFTNLGPEPCLHNLNGGGLT